MTKIGYIRVSSIGQETARQNQLMKDLGVEKVFAAMAENITWTLSDKTKTDLTFLIFDDIFK